MQQPKDYQMEIVAVDLGYGCVKAISSSGKQILFLLIVGNGYERGLMNLFGDTSRAPFRNI
ncbi:hypothetical protein GCM10007063_30990 [Lentibacillus kapialis]|uniref:Actin-like protein N-terminal domain-containing protein n=1 Tax=Lentibacillus kapialis TaxID=340214 RepID=A0A917Q146_9BACI|nr:hypothetical protein [Lentibacillus kapialis]GGK06283.1 hypothetical protein GCM10007063_30990 [Lentibacillus kapialis]